MKNLITILLAVITVSLTAQTKVDSLILVKINNYRAENGKPALIWDTLSYRVSENHAKYMAMTGLLSHDQELEVDSSKSFTTAKQFEDKFLNQGLKVAKGKVVDVAECAAAKFIEQKNFKCMMSADSLAILAVELWKKSPDHNAMILDSTMKYAGSCFKMGTKRTIIELVDNGMGAFDEMVITYDDMISYFFCFNAYTEEYVITK